MTFLTTIREELCALPVKKKCCRRSVLYGMILAKATMTEEGMLLPVEKSYSEYTQELIQEFCGGTKKIEVCARRVLLSFHSKPAEEYLASCETAKMPCAKGCAECRVHFFRGIFLGSGRAENPEKSYRMELISPRPTAVKRWAEEILGEKLRIITRRGETVLLVRNSSGIEDFLMYIGAQDSAFLLMNFKIRHELKGDANRVANCEANNIGKTVQKAMEQTELILRLQEEGLLSSLPQELEETAKLRLQYPELSISQLCLKLPFPISKSGMNHRLNKLMTAAEALLEKSAYKKES